MKSNTDLGLGMGMLMHCHELFEGAVVVKDALSAPVWRSDTDS